MSVGDCALVYTGSGLGVVWLMGSMRVTCGGRMSIRFRMLAAVVAVVASASLGSASPRHSATIDDEALRQQIERRFETSPTLKDQDLPVSVEDGVGTLPGYV